MSDRDQLLEGAARGIAKEIYKGCKDIAGESMTTYDRLTDSDQAACLNLARVALVGAGVIEP